MARNRNTEGERGVNDDGKSWFTVRHNKWDRQDYDRVRKEVQKVPVATDALKEIVGEKVARGESSDAFMMFLKALPELDDPKEITDLARVSRKVNEQLPEVDEYVQLRRFTRGDVVGSALAFTRIEPTLETLYDRLEKEREQAEKLDQLRKELMKLLKQKMKDKGDKGDDEGDGEGEDGDGEGQPGEGQGKGKGDQDGDEPSGGSSPEDPDLDEMIKDLEEQIAEAERELEESLEEHAEAIQAGLAEGLGEAVDAAQSEREAARAWGLEPGQLMRLPADVRLRLAAKMNQDRLRRIAEMFGPMMNVAIAPRQRRVEDIPHEIKRTTVGRDLNHLLPQELLALDDDDLVWDFLKRYAAGNLMQYKMDGTEKVGKGGLVCCVDSSGSMSGTKEMMSKAVFLCLANICKKDNRELTLIHFGNPGAYKEFVFRQPQDWTPDKLIEAVELFMNSGTDFVTPLDRAITHLNNEYKRTGRVRSDIVFITDGECGVPKGWVEKFHEQLDAMDAACWGIAIGCSPRSQPLNQICKGQVCSVTDLQNAGKEIKTIFQGVQR